MRKELVEEIANQAMELSDEDYEKFMIHLKKCIAKDKKEINRTEDKKLHNDEDS